MKCKLVTLCLATAAFFVSNADAHPVQFNFTANGGLGTHYEGFLVVDDDLFDGGTFQSIKQSQLTDFGMSFSQNGTPVWQWSYGDLVLDSEWFFDSSQPVPDIVGMGGLISENHRLVAASTGNISAEFFGASGDWVYVGAVAPTGVPEPSTRALACAALLLAASTCVATACRHRRSTGFRSPLMCCHRGVDSAGAQSGKVA